MFATDIIKEGCRVFKIEPDLLYSSSRKYFVVRARHALFMALRMRGHSYSQIGRWMNRDHSTVAYAMSPVKAHMETDVEYAKTIARLAKGDMK